ncbi:hypothetical protein JJB09_20025 [Rhizobium sp. KVB221]|uniref:Uncharacterized protein n=1 Tax=Rhizobium setariae TaxID=2801340 RepID=A0A937CMH1_9HYPH|nr:hypothetical protein [Rhizobium setariae]MBL0374315.1 hypothetical protein [Rhizobium setariae]
MHQMNFFSFFKLEAAIDPLFIWLPGLGHEVGIGRATSDYPRSEPGARMGIDSRGEVNLALFGSRFREGGLKRFSPLEDIIQMVRQSPFSWPFGRL